MYNGNDISGAVRQNFAEAKKSDIEAVIKVWLRHSAEKLRKLQAKAGSTLCEGEFCVKSTVKSRD